MSREAGHLAAVLFRDRSRQFLADRLVAAGFADMRVPSFAPGAGPDDINLVLWRWSDRRPSRVVLIDDEGRLAKARRSGP